MFTFDTNCKAIAGLKPNCKVMAGLYQKICKVFLGRHMSGHVALMCL